MAKKVQLKHFLGLFVLLLVSCGEQKQEVRVPAEDKTPAQSLNYHALVIGIGDYSGTGWPKLGTAPGDAEAIGQVLQNRYGFNVIQLLDKQATRENMLRTLDGIMELSENDALLIYFAGHGFYDEKMDEGYWIPYGAAHTHDGQPAKEDWLWNSSISRVVSASPARHILLIADTCYGGSLFRGTELTDKSGNWYRRASAMPSRYLITSGNLEPVLDSGIRHSVFAQQILNYLQYAEEPYFSASDIAVAIRERVSELTGQLVRMGPLASPSHAGGEFVFVRNEARLPQGTESMIASSETTAVRGSYEQLPTKLKAYSKTVPASFVRPRILACMGPSGSNEEESAMVRARLHQYLTQSRGCIIVERNTFDSLIKELELGQSDRADQRAASEIGKLLPASLILFGEIIPAGDQNEIHLRIVDTETSRVLSSTFAPYTDASDLDTACRSLSEQVMQTMSRARPLLIPAKRMDNGMIQAEWGSFHGARTGDRFDIIRIDGLGTLAQKETILGNATLLNAGEEASGLEADWNGTQSDEDASLWLKAAF